MKIAIIDPMKRVIITGDSIRSLEQIGLYNYLTKEGHEVHYVSKKIKETECHYIDIGALESLNSYDFVYIHNFNMNLFGGLVSSQTIQFLRLISSYNGQVVYYITDPKLKYLNIAKELFKRKNLKFEINIDQEELKQIAKSISFLELRMSALFTGYNYQPIYGLEFYSIKKIDIFKEIYPLVIADGRGELDLFNEEVGSTKEFDICYFGDNRGSYRNNKIKKYFSNEKIKSLTIGLEMDLPNHFSWKKVKTSELYLMVNKCYSSLVIGDKEHENSFITMRFYENIKFGVVSFIDIDYDSQKTLFKNEKLREFNYVKNSDELISKLFLLKNDHKFMESIINLQKLEI